MMTDVPDLRTLRWPSRLMRPAQGPLAKQAYGVLLPVAVFLLFRLYGVVVLNLFSRHQIDVQESSPDIFVFAPKSADPGYLAVITNWDGQWYQYIATEGYGHPSPGRSPADVSHSWAYPPGYPMVVRLVMHLGLDFAVAASVVSLCCGAVAMVLLYRLLERRKGARFALAGVALFNSFITAPLLQMAYSEAMALFLLVAAFLLLDRRRYGWCAIVVLALSMVRIVTPPFAVVVLAHLLDRYRRRQGHTLRWQEVVALVMLAGLSIGGAWTWDVVSGLLAGESTSGSSRVGDTSIGSIFISLHSFLGWGPVLLLVALLLMLFWLAHLPLMRSWGPDLQAWFWAYPWFIAGVSGLHVGVARYLLLCFPLVLPFIGLLGSGRRALWLPTVGCALVGLVLQWWWIGNVFVISPGSPMP